MDKRLWTKKYTRQRFLFDGETKRNTPIPPRKHPGLVRRHDRALFNHLIEGITMKLWLKRTLLGLFGAGIIAGGLSACGGHHHGHPMSMGEEDAAKFKPKMVSWVSGELELSEPQKQRLGTLADRLREQRLALIGKTTDPRAEVQALVAGAQFDRARAKAVLDEKTGAIQNKSPEVIAAAADFFDSLTPAQQQKVRDAMQRRHGWFGRG